MAFRHSLVAAVACWIAVFTSAGRAQLLGCDSIGCPKDSSSNDVCPIGSTTARAIGITNFTSSLNSDPFTWTVAFSSQISPSNSSVDLLERSYYLGTPPSLDLATETNVKGCGLFFEDVVTRGDFSPSTAGTCSDLLGASCVSDLISQANKTLSQLLADEDTSFVCSKLAVQLRDNAPSSCTLDNVGQWGAIAVQDVAGSSLQSPITIDSTCNPSSEGYNVRRIESQVSTSVPDSTAINAFAWGVTPILTIFYSEDSTSSDDSGTDAPEFHLSCLKPVGQTAIVETTASGTSTLTCNGLVTFVLAAWALLAVI